MERARVKGAELEYEVRGKGEPVLLIHGSHVARSFFPLMSQPALVDSYMLIRYHRRGWLGSTSPHGPFSIEEQAADARALLEHIGVRPPVHATPTADRSPCSSRTTIPNTCTRSP
jgi:pimeloyl-ACP methyl ester carboxylesterase